MGRTEAPTIQTTNATDTRHMMIISSCHVGSILTVSLSLNGFELSSPFIHLIFSLSFTGKEISFFSLLRCCVDCQLWMLYWNLFLILSSGLSKIS
jgi:hypothetical protein